MSANKARLIDIYRTKRQGLLRLLDTLIIELYSSGHQPEWVHLMEIQSLTVPRRRWGIYGIAMVFIGIVTLPYLLGFLVQGDDYVFTGFLLNPIDGNSYLAKMYQGFRGDYKFRLPYTAEPGEGAYLFIFYLFLGHLARLFHLPLIVVFHVARICGAIALIVSAVRLLEHRLGERQELLSFLSLLLFGSGMGWLGLIFGHFTMDFWVAEAFPFLSAYSSPHFSLGLAALLFLVTPREGQSEQGEEVNRQRFGTEFFLSFSISLFLATMSPFAIVLGLILLAGWFAYAHWVKIFWGTSSVSGVQKKRALARICGLAIGGLPLLVYDLAIVRLHPVLIGWDAQNVTRTAPLWDTILSFSPALLLAVFGSVSVIREKRDSVSFLAFWTLVAILLAYLPYALQRRFLFGVYVPIAVLAVLGMQWLFRNLKSRWRRLWVSLVFLSSVLTNVVVLLTGVSAILRHDPRIYLTQAESHALEWLSLNSPPDSFVIASPEMGLFVPAYTGRRVFYGHPFETVNAEEQRAMVERFYQKFTIDTKRAVAPWQGFRPLYIFFGPREKPLGEVHETNDVKVVFSDKEVYIFQVMTP